MISKVSFLIIILGFSGSKKFLFSILIFSSKYDAILTLTTLKILLKHLFHFYLINKFVILFIDIYISEDL